MLLWQLFNLESVVLFAVSFALGLSGCCLYDIHAETLLHSCFVSLLPLGGASFDLSCTVEVYLLFLPKRSRLWFVGRNHCWGYLLFLSYWCDVLLCLACPNCLVEDSFWDIDSRDWLKHCYFVQHILTPSNNIPIYYHTSWSKQTLLSCRVSTNKDRQYLSLHFQNTRRCQHQRRATTPSHIISRLLRSGVQSHGISSEQQQSILIQ